MLLTRCLDSSTSPNRVSSGEPIRLLDNSKGELAAVSLFLAHPARYLHRSCYPWQFTIENQPFSSETERQIRPDQLQRKGLCCCRRHQGHQERRRALCYIWLQVLLQDHANCTARISRRIDYRRKFEEFDKNIPQNILLNRTSVDDDNPFTLQKVKGKGHRRKIAETKWNADVRISPEKLWQECHQEDNLYGRSISMYWWVTDTLTVSHIVRDERIERYGFIHVLGEEPDSDAKHPESAESDPDYFEDPQNAELSRYVLRENRAIWVAHVLDIRTFIGQFWLHVIWMYRPEELPSGRQPHHGKWELIASTHEGIISSESIISAAKVTRFNEGGGELPLEQWYWRQLYNASTRRLSVCFIARPSAQQTTDVSSASENTASAMAMPIRTSLFFTAQNVTSGCIYVASLKQTFTQGVHVTRRISHVKVTQG